MRFAILAGIRNPAICPATALALTVSPVAAPAYAQAAPVAEDCEGNKTGLIIGGVIGTLALIGTGAGACPGGEGLPQLHRGVERPRPPDPPRRGRLRFGPRPRR